jgi:predicted Zn finger-like uncharacterized protein
MFTVCPKCALTLVVTAADLRVAQGYVRCGRCLNVFNALARLSEERPGVAAAPQPEAANAGAPEQGEPSRSSAPREPPAPSAPEAAESPQPFAPEQAELPQSPGPASALEETGEIEIELDAGMLEGAAQTAAAEPQDAVQPGAGPPPPDGGASAQEEPPATEETAAAQTPETAGAQTPGADAAADADDRETTAASEAPPAGAPPGPDGAPESAESAAAADAPDTQQHTNTAPQTSESAFELETRRPRAALAWRLGAGALAIALALQIVNHYRDALAADPALRGPLTTVYSALGVKLAPQWDVHAYDVRQLGASVAGTAAGEIVVRASVKNSANSAQPLPLLRVTLQDRFGNRIAARDVPPSDYLPSSAAPGALLAAGSRVDATMVFVDPGPRAVGFEIDACLRQRGGRVACAHGP